MTRLREKSIQLTNYLEYLIYEELRDEVVIFTPSDPSQRGCQLSLTFKRDLDDIHKRIEALGIICDVRKPNVMRIAPTPLYNSFFDVFTFIQILKSVLLS
jgi:kynureninase